MTEQLNWTELTETGILIIYHCYYWASLLAQLIKESACNVGDLSLIPGLGRSPGEGRGYPLQYSSYPLQYSGLENSMDCVVPGLTKSWTWLSDLHTHMVIIDCAGSLLLHGLSSSCGKQGLLSSHSAWASHRGGISCCGARAQGCTRSSNCGSWALELSSVVVQHRLNCSKACGIFLDQGSNLCLLFWQADSLPPSHQGSLTGIFWIIEKNIIKETYQDCLRQTILAIPLFTLRSIPIQVINYMILLPMMHL